MKPTSDQLRAFHQQLVSQRGLTPPTKEELRTLTVGGDAAGVVPPQFQDFISSLFTTYSSFAQNAERIKANRETYNLPRGTGLPAASWTAEGAVIGESDPTFEQVSVNIQKITAMTRCSNEYLSDSLDDNMIEHLFGLLSKSIASKFEEAAWNGDGTANSGGITGVFPSLAAWNGGSQVVTCTSGDTAMNVVDIDNLWACVGRVDSAAVPNAKWYMSHQAKYSLSARLQSAGGGNNGFDLSGGWDNARMLGFPIVVSDASCFSTTLGADSNATIAAFGDLKLAARFFDRQDFEAKQFSETLATTDEVLLRAKARLSAAVVLPQAMATLKLAAA